LVGWVGFRGWGRFPGWGPETGVPLKFPRGWGLWVNWVPTKETGLEKGPFLKQENFPGAQKALEFYRFPGVFLPFPILGGVMGPPFSEGALRKPQETPGFFPRVGRETANPGFWGNGKNPGGKPQPPPGFREFGIPPESSGRFPPGPPERISFWENRDPRGVFTNNPLGGEISQKGSTPGFQKATQHFGGSPRGTVKGGPLGGGSPKAPFLGRGGFPGGSPRRI